MDARLETGSQQQKNKQNMESNYLANRYKLLVVAGELHKRGYGLLQIIPSLSPSGFV